MPIRVESGARGRADWAFIVGAGGLVLMGTISLLSAASPIPYYSQILQRHGIALIAGLLLFVSGMSFNYQVFMDQAKVIYGFVVAMLVGVLAFGTVQRGHKAWFHVGFLTFQPAELARIAMILVLAAFLEARARKVREFSTVVQGLLIVAPVMALIVKQPDFSTALTFIPIILGMMFCAGANVFHLAGIVGYALAAVSMPMLFTYCQIHYPQAGPGTLPYLILQTSRMGVATFVVLGLAAATALLAWRLSILMRVYIKPVYFVSFVLVVSSGLLSGITINHRMKSYQRNRFVAYMAPQADIQGAAYHVHQSQIAIGSGGPLGKGLFNGTQSQLGFLPERHTDFIYAVVGEEMGFAGTMTILALYLLMIWRIVAVGRLARDRYGYLVCCGLATMFAFELALNVGMCLGLMPVAGIPLPLISYGGSSLMITLWSLGIVANIYSRRYSLL